MYGLLLSPSYIIIVLVVCVCRIIQGAMQQQTLFNHYISPTIPLYAGGMHLLYSILTMPLPLLGVSTGLSLPPHIRTIYSAIPPILPPSLTSSDANVRNHFTQHRWIPRTNHESRSLLVSKHYYPFAKTDILKDACQPLLSLLYRYHSDTSTYCLSRNTYTLSDLLSLPYGFDLQNATVFLYDLGLNLRQYVTLTKTSYTCSAPPTEEENSKLGEIMLEVLKSLTHLHNIGITHCDLHFGNICTGICSPAFSLLKPPTLTTQTPLSSTSPSHSYPAPPPDGHSSPRYSPNSLSPEAHPSPTTVIGL